MCEKLQQCSEGFRNETSHWQFLNAFFIPSITRFFITWFALAPAVVKLFQYLPNPLVISYGGENYSFLLNLPFRWEILWWASLLYAIALSIYLLFCPGFIKRYPNFSSYTDRGHSPRWLVWEIFRVWRSISKDGREKLFKRLSKKEYAIQTETQAPPFTSPSVTKDGTKWVFEYNSNKYVVCIDENLPDAQQKDIFWEILGRYGASLPYARYFTWFFLLISALLVFCVVTQNIYFVLQYFFVK